MIYRAGQELCELIVAVIRYEITRRRMAKTPSLLNAARVSDARADVLYEAADVGNFAMMVADASRSLKSHRGK